MIAYKADFAPMVIAVLASLSLLLLAPQSSPTAVPAAAMIKFVPLFLANRLRLTCGWLPGSGRAGMRFANAVVAVTRGISGVASAWKDAASTMIGRRAKGQRRPRN
jgi:hypothetical protein